MRSEMEEAIIRYEEELECACDVEDFKAGWRAALHSVEAEKEPDAYMDSWEYRDFKRTGVGTIFNTHEHMGKAVPFYLTIPEHKPE